MLNQLGMDLTQDLIIYFENEFQHFLVQTENGDLDFLMFSGFKGVLNMTN